MNDAKPTIAAVQGLLIAPALLFMGALVARALSLPQYELVQNAQRIVMWYSARQWTLWILLIMMPLTVLVSGCLTLLSTGKDSVGQPQFSRQTLAVIAPQGTTLFVVILTVVAAGILAIVALHMLAN